MTELATPPALAWTDALKLDHAQMDHTHEEFVALLGAARSAFESGDISAALACFDDLLQHSVAHFGQEDRWMCATGFAPENCHTRQHATVLQLMREVIRLGREENRTEPLGVLVAELGPWFVQHAGMMDAGLVQHLAAVGYDTATGELRGALPEQALTHCGSGGCR